MKGQRVLVKDIPRDATSVDQIHIVKGRGNGWYRCSVGSPVKSHGSLGV